MNVSSSLSSLQSRKDKVVGDLVASSSAISTAEDKIERLRRVSSSLETSIQSLKNLKGEIDDYEVSDAKWKGDERTQFEAKYNSYVVFVEVYEKDTSEAKEKIDDALEAAKQEKALAQMEMTSLTSSLDSLETDIKKAKED